MKLTVRTPIISDTHITSRYSDGQTTYEHVFTTDAIIPDDPAAHRLAQWLSISHATYLFSLEYFDEMSTEFFLNSDEIRFFEKLFFDGMAEFRYVNNIPIATRTSFSTTASQPSPNTSSLETKGGLLLNGGGKDGLTAGLLLKDADIDFALFQIGTGAAQRLTETTLGTKVHLFTRDMEERRKQGPYQGHRPTSASIAIAAALTALIHGRRDVIASNENSANEPNLELDGVSINHQFTKTFEFEKEFSDLLAQSGIPVRYFSIMRPLHELQIAQILATYPADVAKFISCNHGFRKGLWCGVCAKCAFIILMFTALKPEIVESLFGAPGIINTPELQKHIESLIRPELAKPLECVGTLEESQIAAYIILHKHADLLSPELRTLFENTTHHIKEADIQNLLNGFNEQHNIPDEYMPAVHLALQKIAY